MAELIRLNTFTDSKGSLNVLEVEKDIPFNIKRIFYIFNVEKKIIRGGHRHRKNIQALICVKGSCEIFVNDASQKNVFMLNSPDKCLILNPEDWHTMYNFSADAVLLVLASEHYDVNDYIDEEYK